MLPLPYDDCRLSETLTLSLYTIVLTIIVQVFFWHVANLEMRFFLESSLSWPRSGLVHILARDLMERLLARLAMIAYGFSYGVKTTEVVTCSYARNARLPRLHLFNLLYVSAS